MIRNKWQWSLIMISALYISIAALGQSKIHVRQFGVVPSASADATLGVAEALKAASKQKQSCELLFDEGEYHFYGAKASEKYQFVSNNDEGLKRIIFLIEDCKNLSIVGNNSRFVFHGMVNPFVVERSSNIQFKGFSVDFSRSFHSEGIILSSYGDEMDIEISDEFPFRIQNNILQFTDNQQENIMKTTVSRSNFYTYGSLLEFDTQKRETAFMAYDYYINEAPLVAKQLSSNRIRITLKGLKGTPGNTMVFAPGHRNYPAFIVSDSRDMRFENLTIHHAGGMGIVGQRTHNVLVENCKVTPSGKRMISCTADATHFTNCTGKIELKDNLFINQLDDATNIHGVYVQIVEKISMNEVYVKLKHLQQFGFDFLKKGMMIEFVQGSSLITKGSAQVVEVKRLNKELSRVKLDKPLPPGINEGDAICEVRSFPEIHIHGNYIGKNRARGMLLNCRGKTVVENNIFHSPGAAILFEGDAKYWFEQGGVRDCIIRNNVFDNCLFGVWGKAIIDVAAGIEENREESRYNRNIQIYGNTFRVFDNPLLLHAYGVDNMVWKQNMVEHTNDYPAVHNNPSPYKIEYCDNMTIEE